MLDIRLHCNLLTRCDKCRQCYSDHSLKPCTLSKQSKQSPQETIPHPHLSVMSYSKMFLEKDTDLHVAQVGNRHDSHFRDVVTKTTTEQMTVINCTAVCNLPGEVRIHRHLASMFSASRA